MRRPDGYTGMIDSDSSGWPKTCGNPLKSSLSHVPIFTLTEKLIGASMKMYDPESIHAAFAQAYNDGNIEDLIALYEPDAVLIPQPGHRAVGRSAIKDSLMDLINLKGIMQIQTLSCLRSGDLALLQASWHLSATGPDGRPMESSARTAEVVRKQSDGSWLLVIDNAFAEGGS